MPLGLREHVVDFGFVAGIRLNHPDVRPRVRQIGNAYAGDIAHENPGAGVRQHFRNCPARP